MGLPTGTVTFVMTDIEGSTRLLRRLGGEYPRLLADHHRVVRRALADHDGVEVSTEGDSFFCVFRSARAAVDAAVDVQRGLSKHPWPQDAEVRVRAGLHTGEGTLGDTGYVGLDVHRCARVAAAAHGGQVLLTAATRALVEGSWPPGVGYVFLGSHRLKDLEGPELLYQLVVEGLPTRFPPIRSLEAPAYDLPSTHSAFVGREADVAALTALLETHRLVTITGPGGVGKTRLAVGAAAATSSRYPAGVAFVPLAAVHDVHLVPDEIARALALPGTDYGGRRGLQRLGEQVGDRRMLLILDNVEQLLPQAAELGALVEALPAVTVLATSRAPLRLLVEQEYPLTPLRVPTERDEETPERLLSFPAVQQFVDRARAVRPGFELRPQDAHDVACIVRGVDGLPLAVELVAARLRTLPLHQIAARLGDQLSLLRGGPRDLPARQQALRETLRWSYDLLEPAGQTLLPVLAVFPGGTTLEALESVASQVMDRADVVDALDSLVAQGLVLRAADSSDRYRTLQVVRELAAELLAESGSERAVRSRVAEWVHQLVADTAPQLVTERQAEALNRLRDEHDNLRAALAWCREHDPVLGARVAAGVWRYWQMRGHLGEGAAVLDQLLERLPAECDPYVRAAALSARGGLAYWQLDRPVLRAAYQEAVRLYEGLDDPAGLAGALYDLAFPTLQTGDLDEAVALAERSGRIFAGIGDAHGIARTQWVRGIAAIHGKDYPLAQELLEDAVRRFRGLGDTYYLGWSLRMLGRAHLERGDTGTARPLLDESMRLFAAAGDTSGILLHLADFAALAGLEGDDERQVRIVGAMRRLQRDTGTDLVDYSWNDVLHLQEALAAVGDRAELLLAEGAAMPLDQAVGYALGG